MARQPTRYGEESQKIMPEEKRHRGLFAEDEVRKRSENEAALKGVGLDDG
jgi:hypothetical protein